MRLSSMVFAMCLAMTIVGFNGCKSPGLYEEYGEGFRPKAGFVPDSATAIRIAIAVLIPIYGEDLVNSEKPYTATLKDGVWEVAGSLPGSEKGTVVGGVAIVRIAQKDGRVLYFLHTV
jgi:hypothetical protein